MVNRMDDLIYRQAAIDALHGYFDGMLETDTWSPCDVYELIEILPSAQPECDDTVSRKAEIDAIKRYIRGFDAIDVNFLDGLKTAIQIIEQLPHEYSNAQNTLQRVGSVECEDVVSRQAAIDTVRSYYDECDEREESIEERIERLPSADIDLSGFCDKLWRAAYERGKAEVVRCKDCRYGHRYFDIIYDTTDSWVECRNPDGLNRDVSEDSFCSYGEQADG